MKKNFLFAGLTNFFKVFSGIVLFAFYARCFSLDEFGSLSYAIVISVLIGLFVDYGYAIFIPKEGAKDTSQINNIVGRAFKIKIIISVVLLALLFFGISYGIIVADPFIVFVVSLSSIVLSLATTFVLPYRSIDKFELESACVIKYHAVLIVSALIVLYVVPTVKNVAFCYFFSRAFFFAISFKQYRKDFKLIITNNNLIEELRLVLPYAMHAILASLFLSFDTTILAKYVDISGIAIYQAGMKFVVGSSFVLSVFYDVLIPRLAHLIHSNKRLFLLSVFRYNYLIIFFGLLVASVLLLFSEDIILFIFGIKYIALNEYIYLFSCLIFLRCFGAMYNTLLTVSSNQKIRAISLAISLCVMVMFDLVLIPRYQIYGALYALIVSHVVLYGLAMIVVGFEFKTFFLIRTKNG